MVRDDLSARNYLFRNRFRHRLRFGMNMEFFVNIPDVCADGKHAQEEFVGHRLVVIPFHKQLKYLEFPWGETVICFRWRRVLPKHLKDLPCDVRRHRRTTPKCLLHRLKELLRHDRLCNVSTCSHADRAKNVCIIFIDTQNNNLYARMFPLQKLYCFDSIDAWQPDIHEHNVRGGPIKIIDEALRIRILANN